MVNLTDLGFSKNTIAETILSTYNKNREPNAAPMGATQENEKQLMLKVFNSSSTLQNLKQNKAAVVNLTSDVTLFYRTTFKETNPQGTMPSEWFQKAQTVNAPRLLRADATIEVTIKDMSPIDTQRTKVLCNAEHIDAKTAFPKAYCRAFGATLEAIIHATRVKAFAKDPNEQLRVAKLLERIANCDDVASRTAPNSQYTEIMRDLNQKIQTWRAHP
jgi:hypothetical protein